MNHQQETIAKETNLVLSYTEGVSSVRCGKWLTRAWHCRGIVSVIEYSFGCPAPRRTQAYWKVSRRKQQEEIKKWEKRLKELNLFSATKRKLLCNLAVCQHVIMVIKVPDFHGSLIYWFANLPGWFRLDVEKISCYHHETVARPPRQARKPPSLGVVTDKIDDALSGQSPRSVVACCFWFVGPPSLCLTEQGEEEGAAWLESAGCAKEGDRDGRTVRRWRWEVGVGRTGWKRA